MTRKRELFQSRPSTIKEGKWRNVRSRIDQSVDDLRLTNDRGSVYAISVNFSSACSTLSRCLISAFLVNFAIYPIRRWNFARYAISTVYQQGFTRLDIFFVTLHSYRRKLRSCSWRLSNVSRVARFIGIGDVDTVRGFQGILTWTRLCVEFHRIKWHKSEQFSLLKVKSSFWLSTMTRKSQKDYLESNPLTMVDTRGIHL